MSNLSLEDFVDSYIEAVSEAIQGNHLPDLDSFYEDIFKRVHEKTGLSREEINSLHHPFHWYLFSEKNSPLELFFLPTKTESNYKICIRQKGLSLEKTELVKGILEKYKTLLQQRLDKILQYHN
jgi:hypothetical protein